MLSAKEVTLISPDQSGGGRGDVNGDPIDVGIKKHDEKSDKVKLKIYDKIHRFIKVILRLAKYDSYDDEYRIKSENGDYVKRSNIVDLLTNSMSPGKILHGEEEFISLLARANVDPELLLNENIKSKLLNYQLKDMIL